MSRVIFFEPSTHHQHIYKHFKLPRLGSIVLGTILKQAGHDVKVFIGDVQPPRMRDMKDADLVCLSTISSTAPQAYKVARQMREKGIPVAIGGPHVTFMPEEAAEQADYVFRGEAERSIVPLVEAIVSGRGMEDVPGLTFKRDGEVVHNRPAEAVGDLDEIPDPDLNLLVGGFKLAWTNTLVPMQTSRGCPHNCSFCSVTRMFGRKMRYRSVGRVLDEIARVGAGRRHIFFYDDNFAANRNRLREIAEGILKRDLRVEWSAQVRVELARDTELLHLLRRAGCRILYIGFESVNPETLKGYEKGQTVEDIEHAIRVFHRHKLYLHGMFVLGSDTDTVETVRATSQFAKRLRLETVQFLILTPLPGTPVFQQLDDDDRLGIRDWSFYDGHHVVYEPTLMTPYELQFEVMRAHSDFYSLPQIMGEAVRLRFFEALLKIYAHRVERRFERLSGWFLEGLDGGLDTVKAVLDSGQIPMPAGIRA
jgi:radical SAM superfamily enzyme YgiQ (UPF0313 family)